MPVSNLKVVKIYYGHFVPAQLSRITVEIQALSHVVPIKDHLVVQYVPDPNEDIPGSFGVEVLSVTSNNFLSSLIHLARFLRENNFDIVHSHGLYSGLLASLAILFSLSRKTVHVYEVHGAVSFESYFRNSKSPVRIPKFAALYILESLAIILSNRLLLVSDLVTRYYPVAKVKSFASIPRYLNPVYPTLSDCENNGNFTVLTDFIKARRVLGRKIVVYSGSVDKWQLPSETVLLMSEMVRRFDFSAVILTNSQKMFKDAIAARMGTSHPDFCIVKLPSVLVLKALSQCDVGVILRDDLVLNKVASPTKLYEYLYSGLALITTTAVSEAQHFIGTYRNGVNVDISKLNGEFSYVDSLIGDINRSIDNSKQLPADFKNRFLFQNSKDVLIGLYR